MDAARTRSFRNRPERDARRRDFTINGLLLDPDTDEVLDYVGGRADLEHRCCAPLAIPTRAFAKTICGCCAPFASPRG